MLQPFFGHPEPIVFHLDDRVALPRNAADRDPPLADFPSQAVLDRVLDERLQDHARHDDVEAGLVDLLVDHERGAKADALDVQILVDRRKLLAKGHEVLLVPQQTSQQA